MLVEAVFIPCWITFESTQFLFIVSSLSLECVQVMCHLFINSMTYNTLKKKTIKCMYTLLRNAFTEEFVDCKPYQHLCWMQWLLYNYNIGFKF